MNAHIVTLSVFALSCTTFAQRDYTSPGTCPKVNTTQNFNTGKYKGIWYEIKRYENTLITGPCGQPNYNQLSTGFNVTYHTKGANNVSIIYMELRKQNVVNASGKYDVYIRNKKESVPHFILETDYTSYSVVWGCSYQNNQNIQRTFIYSRKQTLSGSTLTNVNNLLSRYGINPAGLVDVSQDSKVCKGIGEGGNGGGGNGGGGNGGGGAESIRLSLFGVFGVAILLITNMF